jgi:hypothetical protein
VGPRGRFARVPARLRGNRPANERSRMTALPSVIGLTEMARSGRRNGAGNLQPFCRCDFRRPFTSERRYRTRSGTCMSDHWQHQRSREKRPTGLSRQSRAGRARVTTESHPLPRCLRLREHLGGETREPLDSAVALYSEDSRMSHGLEFIKRVLSSELRDRRVRSRGLPQSHFFRLRMYFTSPSICSGVSLPPNPGIIPYHSSRPFRSRS